jgi:hypothetical protein
MSSGNKNDFLDKLNEAANETNINANTSSSNNNETDNNVNNNSINLKYVIYNCLVKLQLILDTHQADGENKKQYDKRREMLNEITKIFKNNSDRYIASLADLETKYKSSLATSKNFKPAFIALKNAISAQNKLDIVNYAVKFTAFQTAGKDLSENSKVVFDALYNIFLSMQKHEGEAKYADRSEHFKQLISNIMKTTSSEDENKSNEAKWSDLKSTISSAFASKNKFYNNIPNKVIFKNSKIYQPNLEFINEAIGKDDFTLAEFDKAINAFSTKIAMINTPTARTLIENVKPVEPTSKNKEEINNNNSNTSSNSEENIKNTQEETKFVGQQQTTPPSSPLADIFMKRNTSDAQESTSVELKIETIKKEDLKIQFLKNSDNNNEETNSQSSGFSPSNSPVETTLTTEEKPVEQQQNLDNAEKPREPVAEIQEVQSKNTTSIQQEQSKTPASNNEENLLGSNFGEEQQASNTNSDNSNKAEEKKNTATAFIQEKEKEKTKPLTKKSINNALTERLQLLQKHLDENKETSSEKNDYKKQPIIGGVKKFVKNVETNNNPLTPEPKRKNSDDINKSKLRRSQSLTSLLSSSNFFPLPPQGQQQSATTEIVTEQEQESNNNASSPPTFNQ